MAILELQKLTMRFGGITAVWGVDLKVEPGQIYSVIGPNGAGKTTVFNAITGIYQPSAGKVLFEGHSVQKPLSARIILTTILVGLVTASLAFLSAVGAEGLWYAIIKRPTNSVGETRSLKLSTAYTTTLEYVQGEPVVEKRRRSSLWAVTTADGKTELALARSLEEARSLRSDFRNYLLGPNPPDSIPVGSQLSAEQLREMQDPRNARHINNLMMLTSLGFMIGSVGYFVMWRRARRSADTIALQGIARTFQNIRLFQNMTVLENVLVGRHRESAGNWFLGMIRWPSFVRQEKACESRVIELLKFIGLAGRSGVLAKSLAYGDQRRLEIARALASNPKVLLLDEPAAGMNPSETVDLMDLIRRIRDRGVTVLLIEHHMSLVMGISDRVAVLDYGVKIAEGTPSEISRDPRVIEAYLGKEEVN